MAQTLLKRFTDSTKFLTQKKLILATSGGLDSMVMADLCLRSNHHIAIAHCNFQLRDIESDEDADFVNTFASKNNTPVYTTRFDTVAFADDFKLSIQVAARELRYRWFAELLESENYDYVLTAHHADDCLETFLINLSRGTGIDGLTGIPQQNDRIVRPMLQFSRDQILAYANDRKLEWREDSSNASDKYLRNKIRQNVVPALKEINPLLLDSFQKTQRYLRETQAMAQDASVLVYQQVAQQADDEIHFNLQKLQKLPNYESYLYQWLHSYGFTAWDDISRLVDSESGKVIYAPNFRLIRQRHFLLLAPLSTNETAQSYTVGIGERHVNFPIKLEISEVAVRTDESNNTIFVDAQKLQFPLSIRKWAQGDLFEPLGMNGQSKKVSKFFKDEQFTTTQKEQSWLLCSKDKIVWIVGHRADDRFKISESTNQILKITHTP